MRSMFAQVPMQTGYRGVRHVAVSLPRVDFLVAELPAKYVVPAPDVGPIAAAPVRGRGRMSHAEARYIEKRLV